MKLKPIPKHLDVLIKILYESGYNIKKDGDYIEIKEDETIDVSDIPILKEKYIPDIVKEEMG